jgi:hypothetical protein
MNKSAQKKSVGNSYRIRPIAKRFKGGPGGLPLPPVDDVWKYTRYTARYGPADETTQGTYQNGFGATFHEETSVWKDPVRSFLLIVIDSHQEGVGITLIDTDSQKKQEQPVRLGDLYHFRCLLIGGRGGGRTHTKSELRQILSLVRLPVPPLGHYWLEC